MASEPQDGSSCRAKDDPGNEGPGTPGGEGNPVEANPEGSGIPVDRPAAALRIGLIALVALAALALSLHEARTIPSLPFPRIFSRTPDFLEALPETFPVLEDDVALAAEPVFINGREVTSVRLASPLDPVSLTAEYARRLKPLGYACVPGGAAPGRSGAEFVRFKGTGQAMLGFRDPEGFPMGIVAFENAKTG
ncbi:MAG: hypothetical protein ACYS47_19485, partial [Planctomycetota bacterium]